MQPRDVGLLVGLVVSAVGIVGAFVWTHLVARRAQMSLDDRLRLSMGVGICRVVACLGLYFLLILLFDVEGWFKGTVVLVLMPFMGPAFRLMREKRQ